MWVNGQNMNLQQYMEHRRERFHYDNMEDWAQSELDCWILQDWYGSMGDYSDTEKFSPEDTEWLKQNNLLEVALWATEEE